MLQLQSENINELAGSLAKAQSVIINPAFDSNNPFFKSKYASLGSVIDACKPMHDFGLSYSQSTTIIDDKFYIVTTIYHTSGQWIRSYNPIICKDAQDPQKFGSAISYSRRYALQAIIGVTGEADDDANAASAPGKTITIEQANEVSKIIGDDTELRIKIINAIRAETKNPKAAIPEMPAERLKAYLSSIAQHGKNKDNGNNYHER